MDFDDGSRDFSAEDVETIVKSNIAVVLNDAMYNGQKTNDWSNSIIDSTLKGLQSLNRPFKYIVTVVIMQKNGAGMVSSASTYWDATKDGLCKVKWENGTIHCLVTVFGISIQVDGPATDE